MKARCTRSIALAVSALLPGFVFAACRDWDRYDPRLDDGPSGASTSSGVSGGGGSGGGGSGGGASSSGGANTGGREGTAGGPVACWRLDEGEGVEVGDECGSNEGVLHGSGWAPGREGTALAFDGGVGQHVDFDNPAALQLTSSMTVTAWIFLDNGYQQGKIIAKQGGATERGWSLSIEASGVLRFDVALAADDDIGVATPRPVSQLVWVHVAGVYDAEQKEVSVWLDGKPINSHSDTALGAMFDSPVDVNIGRRPSGPACCTFHGKIDDVRVYARALSPAELAALAAR